MRSRPHWLWLLTVGVLAVQALRAHSVGLFGLDFSPVYDGLKGLLRGDPYPHTVNQPFVYPPSAAALLAPLAVLRAPVANDAGLLLVLAGFVGLGSGSAAVVGRSAQGALAALLTAAVAFSGVGYFSLILVTMSAVVAGVLAWVVAFAVRGRWITAAVLFGVGVALKPLIAPAILLFLLHRRWRAAAIALAVPVFLNLALLPFLNRPLLFVTDVLPKLIRGATLPDMYNSSLAVIVRDRAGTQAAIVSRVAIVALTVFVCVWCSRRNSPVALAAAASSPVLGLALVGHTNESHYVLVSLPLLVAVAAVGSAWAKLAVALTVVVLALPGVGSLSSPVWATTVAEVMCLLLPLTALRSQGPQAHALKASGIEADQSSAAPTAGVERGH